MSGLSLNCIAVYTWLASYNGLETSPQWDGLAPWWRAWRSRCQAVPCPPLVLKMECRPATLSAALAPVASCNLNTPFELAFVPCSSYPTHHAPPNWIIWIINLEHCTLATECSGHHSALALITSAVLEHLTLLRDPTLVTVTGARQGTIRGTCSLWIRQNEALLYLSWFSMTP